MRAPFSSARYWRARDAECLIKADTRGDTHVQGEKRHSAMEGLEALCEARAIRDARVSTEMGKFAKKKKKNEQEKKGEMAEWWNCRSRRPLQAASTDARERRVSARTLRERGEGCGSDRSGTPAEARSL